MRRADRLLLLAMVILAGLLGCYELFDPDVWWHLRAGRWILEHRRIPRLDPFTFSSADRPWIDLHWGFQLALAAADAMGGVPGMILLGALASASAFAIAMTARRSEWPAWLLALCWHPALALMATRFDPRPEVFSLVYLAGFLAILFRVDRRPALAWFLVPIQLLWVNSHGLFILGPIVVACDSLDRVARAWLDGRRRKERPDPGRPSAWRHVAPASAAVLAATLVNPYGISGALFPLELLPKIADANNPYKAYIDEFASVRSTVRKGMAAASGAHFHLRIQVFLLLMIAWSFVPPAIWRTWRESPGHDGPIARSRAFLWPIGMSALLGLAVVAALGLPLPGTPAWLSRTARAMPAVLLIAGVVAASIMASRSGAAAATTLVGTSAAAWAFWLRAYLFEEPSGTFEAAATAMPYIGAGLGVLAVVLIVRAGGSLFRILLAAAFTYLALQAVRNINIFALVGATVLVWNLGEWSDSMAPARPSRLAAWLPAAIVCAIVAAWSLGVVTDSYYALVGEDVHFGLRERPSTFAHRASQFAGRPGLPAHALVFDLGQAGVYVYHNGPDRKVFIDGRLEVPSPSTFREYLRIEDQLNRNDPRWVVAVNRLGDPLILVSHEGWSEAEATLLAHPRWRCIYFDEIASLFVPRGGPSSAPGVPEIDFTTIPGVESVTSTPAKLVRLRREAETLLRLGTELRRRGGDPWRVRIPILIGAARRARALIARDTANPAYWTLLGLVEWETVPDLTRPPPGPGDPWDPAVGLPWARATYCFRRALAAAPRDGSALNALAGCLGVRRMTEARSRVESWPSGTDQPIDVFRSLEGPLERVAPSSWTDADRIAGTLLHLGNPEAARRVWAEAADPHPPALRPTRMAGADLAGFDAEAAEARCRQALALDSRLGEAWFVLAVALFEAGRIVEALDACRESLKRELTVAQRERIQGLVAVLEHRQSGLPAGFAGR